MTSALMAHECDAATESELEEWTPPRKKLALQTPDHDPCHPPPLIDEHVTVITDAKVVLRHHAPELAQYIKLECILPYLNQQHLLTDDENDILLNLMLSERMRILKLLKFIESKGPEGFQRFLRALQDEPEHLGHKELTELFTPYRCRIPSKSSQPHSMQAITNSVALQAAMKPIQGSEFDLDETSIHKLSGEDTSHVVESSGRVCSVAPADKGDQMDEKESIDNEIQEMKEYLGCDEADMASTSTKVLQRYPNLVFPSGPLKKKAHSLMYTSLFKMAWGGDEDRARSLMTYLRRNRDISVDLKIVSMEVVHTVNTERDLKVLTSALAYTDRPECENTTILKCRLHRRIAGLHYRNKDLEEADEHMETALQLAHNIGPDIDTIYTMRLKALMLFEDYKKTRNKGSYRDANKFFTKAMDHARQQPESKRVITERVKVSKALFHLDMREECRQQEKEHDTLEELEYRAQDTLDDVEEEYLTDGDRAFFYLTRAKLLVCSENWIGAQTEAEKALVINKRCGFDKRARDAEELLTHITTAHSTNVN